MQTSLRAWLPWFATLLVLAMSLWSAGRIGGDQIRWPLDLSVEGSHIHAARALGDGIDPWSQDRFLDPPFHPVIYPPAWTIALAWIGEDAVNPFLRARLFAVVCGLLALAVAVLASRDRLAALLLVASVLALPVVATSWVMARPDAMASLFLVGSLGILLRFGDRGAPMDLLCGFLFGLALATKQTGLWFAPALAHRVGWSQGIARAAGCLLGIGSVFMAAAAMGGDPVHAMESLVWADSPLDWVSARVVLESASSTFALPLVAGLWGLGAIGLTILSGRRWLGIAVLGGFAFALVGWSRPGGSLNYLVDPILLGGVILLDARSQALPRFAGVWAILAVVCLLDATVVPRVAGASLAPLGIHGAAQATRIRLVSICARPNERILDLGTLSTPLSAGCRDVEGNDLVLNLSLWAEHPEGAESLVQRIRSGTYDLIMLAEGTPYLKRIDRSGWMPRIADAISGAGYCPVTRTLSGLVLERCPAP